MKTTMRILQLTSLLVWVGLLMSCSKDDDNPAPSGQRIVKSNTYSSMGELIDSSLFTYSDSKLTEVFSYQKNWDLESRETFTYSGNELRGMELSMKTGSAWVMMMKTEILSNSGSLPLEVASHIYDSAGNDQYLFTTSYSYDQSILTKTVETGSYMGVQYYSRIVDYLYDNAGNIVQVTDTGQNYSGQIMRYLYEGGRMSAALGAFYIYGVESDSVKYQYLYDGVKLAAKTEFRKIYGVWEQVFETGYDYDASGNLIRETHPGDFYIVYQYGQGTGNVRQCMQLLGEIILPGDPVPYPVKSVIDENLRNHAKPR